MKSLFFVIPVYKVENYLKRCVESVLSQTYPNTEIILVNDGSPDNCPKICDEYANKYENIIVIHKENGGLSDARNAGIKYVQKTANEDDYITFVDSDDYVHTDYAKVMIDLCESNKCDVAQSDYEKGDSDTFSTKNIKKNTEVTSSYNALLGYRLKSQACAKIYKVKLFEALLYPVNKINEDEFITYRAIFASEKVAFTNQKLYYYFQHGTGIMADIASNLKNNPHKDDFLEAYMERIKFFKKQNMPDQVMKTREKICTDVFLRYSEQLQLKKNKRDNYCTDGTYLRIYRENFKLMIKRHGIPLHRMLMYVIFYIMPSAGMLAGKIPKMRR